MGAPAVCGRAARRLFLASLLAVSACDSRLGTGFVETGRSAWRLAVADAVFELGAVPAPGSAAPGAGAGGGSGEEAGGGSGEAGGGSGEGAGGGSEADSGATPAPMETPFVLLWSGELDCAAPELGSGRGWLLAAWMREAPGAPIAWGAGRYTAPCHPSQAVCAELRVFEVVAAASGGARLTSVPISEGEIILDEIEPRLWTSGSFDVAVGDDGLQGGFFARDCPGLLRALRVEEVLP